MIEGRLTEAQEGLWLARRLDPDNPCQNTGQILRLTGPITAAEIAKAVDTALAEATGLRVRIAVDADTPRMTSVDVALPTTLCVDHRGAPDPERAARAAIHADIERPRDPTSDPMVTSAVHTLGPTDHLWYLTVQHLVIDGYGTTLFNHRVLDLLAAGRAGRTPRTRVFGSMDAVLAEDQEYRNSDRREEDRRWWLDTLSELGEVESFRRGEPLAGAFHHRARRPFPESLRGALESLAKKSCGSWPDALAAGVGVYLERHTSSPPVLGVPLMNRLASATARVPCTTMNVVPLPVRAPETETAEAVVAGVATTMKGARRHGRFRSEVLRRDLGRVGAGRRLFGPLVNVLPFHPLPSLEGVATELEVLGAGPVDDITFTVRGGGASRGLTLEVDSNPALYDLTETEAHADRLLGFLTRFAESTGPLAAVETLGEAERTHWLSGVNATHHPVEETTLVELFRRRAEAAPETPALVGRTTLNYRQLHRAVVACAARLSEGGVTRGDVVAVVAERSVERVIAYLATMWVGAAYLPIDPDHPVERSLRIVESAAPAGVVAPPEHRALAATLGCRWLGWPAAVEAAAREEIGPDARPDAGPEDAAYVIFTSGSTGAPKGVVIEHRAIVNRLEWMRTAFDIAPPDRILQKTPATFDVSVWELFLPFVSGATLVVAPPGVHRDPAHLAALVREEAITAMHFVPAMLGPFLDAPESEGLHIARVFCSGEKLEAPLRDRFHRRIRGQLHNLYGPTEAAVDVTHWAAPPSDRSDPVPIGRPVWNTRTYILDGKRRPVPPGVSGELHLAGRQLAREYLGRPDLTRERFVADPFHPGERMYRTGDRARWSRDGVILFDGRLDRQVKVRGQRIELGEVEAGLMALPGVADAVAALPRNAAPGAGLVAWVTAEGGATGAAALDPHALRDELARRLPEAMVPSAVMVLDFFPLTPSGKTDQRALPEPPAAQTGDGGAPETPTQQRVADLYARALGLSGTPGPTDDFFRLGGHSLAAIEVLAGLRAATGVSLGPGALFSSPTVAALATVVDDALRAGRGSDPAVGEEAGLAPLLPLAAGPPDGRKGAVYCIHPAGGIAWCYTALAHQLGRSVAVVGVQSPWLVSDGPLPHSLEALASQYVDTVLAAHGEGPIHLLGWSVGGIIAHAMAHELHARGRSVGCLALLDAYPADYWHDQPDPEADAPLRALLLIAGEDPDRFAAEQRLDRAAVRSVLRERRHVLGTLSDEALDGVVRVVGLNNRLVRTHRHPRLETDVIHFRAALDHLDSDIDPAAWTPYVASMESHPIPAIHPHMTGPTASTRIARVLTSQLAASGDGSLR